MRAANSLVSHLSIAFVTILILHFLLIPITGADLVHSKKMLFLNVGLVQDVTILPVKCAHNPDISISISVKYRHLELLNKRLNLVFFFS